MRSLSGCIICLAEKRLWYDTGYYSEQGWMSWLGPLLDITFVNNWAPYVDIASVFVGLSRALCRLGDACKYWAAMSLNKLVLSSSTECVLVKRKAKENKGGTCARLFSVSNYCGVWTYCPECVIQSCCEVLVTLASSLRFRNLLLFDFFYHWFQTAAEMMVALQQRSCKCVLCNWTMPT